MSIVNFNVTPKYKKSFVEFNYLEKKVENNTINVVQEMVWRFGEINVQIKQEELDKFENVEELFKSLQSHNVLLFNDKFPYEYEFDSSWDGCSNDYSISYEDGSEVEDELEEEIMNIIEEDGIYELEDSHGYIMVNTTYEMEGELSISKIEDE